MLSLPTGYEGDARGINGLADVVGRIWANDIDLAQPALWHNGQLQTLSTLDMPAGNANALNNCAQIVGLIYDDNRTTPGMSQAVLWSNNQVTTLGNFSNAQSFASAINNQGQALIIVFSSGQTQTWEWNSGALMQITSPTARN